MERKRRLAFFLSIILCIATLLTACGAKEQPSSDSNTTTDSINVSKVPETDDKNEQGSTSTGLTDPNVAEPGTIPVLKEPTDIIVGISEDPNVLDYEDNYMTKWIKERTNVNIIFHRYPNKSSEARQVIELAINSKSELPEIILGILNEAGRNNYGAAGALIELTEYYEKQGKFFYDACAEAGIEPEDLFRYVRSPDGGLYGMVSWDASLLNQYSVRAWINVDFLKALNMEAPTTTEELYSFLKAVKEEDVNGNGDPSDEIGILGSVNGWNGNPLIWLLNSFIYMDNTDNRFILKDGILDVAYDKDEFREGLKFARKLADEGLLSTNSFTQDYNQYLAAINAEDPIVAIGVSGGTGGFNERIFSYDAMPAIKGPNGVVNATWTPPVPSTNAYITKDCKSPEAAFAFLSIGYSEHEYSIIKRYGEPNVDWVPATEGEKGLFEDIGYPATIKVVNNVWGNPQKSHWQSTSLPYIERVNVEAGLVTDPNDPANANALRNARAVMNLMPYSPDEAVVKIIYTPEEIEQTSELRAAIQSYVKESMVQFVAGNLDPYSDDDWNAYLKELERLNYKDVLEVDRQAYNRTMGK